MIIILSFFLSLIILLTQHSSPDAVNEKLLRYKWINRNDNDYRGFKNDEQVFLADGIVLMYPFRFNQYEIEAFSNIYTDFLCKWW